LIEIPAENPEIKQKLAESQAEAQARIMEIEKQLHGMLLLLLFLPQPQNT
jgi:hypothetical protein